ncbi:MAG: hypothetical protein HYV28_10630 [Ignavibacteriales bacterium]|nr:hypothetical protein [Ignavibacteriales bacterium]
MLRFKNSEVLSELHSVLHRIRAHSEDRNGIAIQRDSN